MKFKLFVVRGEVGLSLSSTVAPVTAAVSAVGR
jgi:hypothetical protein